jgi:hypothetical protein
MSKIWFRRRTGSQGIGYGVASLEGLIVLFAFIALFTVTFRLAIAWAKGFHLGPMTSAVLVGAPLLAELGAFLWLVRFKSDDVQG